jgi:hypothetical protein
MEAEIEMGRRKHSEKMRAVATGAVFFLPYPFCVIESNPLPGQDTAGFGDTGGPGRVARFPRAPGDHYRSSEVVLRNFLLFGLPKPFLSITPPFINVKKRSFPCSHLFLKTITKRKDLKNDIKYSLF